MEDFAGKHTGSHKPAFIWGANKAWNTRGWRGRRQGERAPLGPGKQSLCPNVVTVTEQPARCKALVTNDRSMTTWKSIYTVNPFWHIHSWAFFFSIKFILNYTKEWNRVSFFDMSMTDMFFQVRQKEPELLCRTKAYCRMSKSDTDSPPNVHVCPKISKCCLFTWRFLKITTALKFKTPLPLLQNHREPFQRSAVERLQFWVIHSHVLWGHAPSVPGWMRASRQRQTHTRGCSTHREGPSATFSENIFSFQSQDKKSVLKCTEETHGWSPIP